ncbi:hypothetical protein ACOMHN_028272 [Nucella lapillus]
MHSSRGGLTRRPGSVPSDYLNTATAVRPLCLRRMARLRRRANHLQAVDVDMVLFCEEAAEDKCLNVHRLKPVNPPIGPACWLLLLFLMTSLMR